MKARSVLLGALALVPLVTILPAASAVPTHSPAVYGAGSGPLDADTIHVLLIARGQGEAASGRFTIVHQTPTGIFARLSGRVDCLSETGPTAVVTGTITSGFDGLGIDPIGHRVSLAVHDTNPDIVEMDVSFVSGQVIPPCTSAPILSIDIDRGGFRVG